MREQGSLASQILYEMCDEGAGAPHKDQRRGGDRGHGYGEFRLRGLFLKRLAACRENVAKRQTAIPCLRGSLSPFYNSIAVGLPIRPLEEARRDCRDAVEFEQVFMARCARN